MRIPTRATALNPTSHTFLVPSHPERFRGLPLPEPAPTLFHRSRSRRRSSRGTRQRSTLAGPPPSVVSLLHFQALPSKEDHMMPTHRTRPRLLSPSYPRPPDRPSGPSGRCSTPLSTINRSATVCGRVRSTVTQSPLKLNTTMTTRTTRTSLRCSRCSTSVRMEQRSAVVCPRLCRCILCALGCRRFEYADGLVLTRWPKRSSCLFSPTGVMYSLILNVTVANGVFWRRGFLPSVKLSHST